MVALPPLSVAAAEVYPPPVSVTDPDGAGLPLPPLMETVTVSPWADVIDDEDGIIATIGVVFTTAFTVSRANPDPIL